MASVVVETGIGLGNEEIGGATVCWVGGWVGWGGWVVCLLGFGAVPERGRLNSSLREAELN